MRCITLITDFGLRDGFVGVMKGVIAARAPRARVIDLTHEVPPGDLRFAAFVLMSTYRHFPKGTVHLVVVDPGVGTSRRAIAARCAGHFFVGPDNGVLSWALTMGGPAVVELKSPRHRLSEVSRTFHGRDIFAPAAAAVAAGTALRRLGPPAPSPVRMPFPKVVWGRDGARGEGLVVDRFGNLITNIDERGCGARWRGRRLLALAGRRTIPVVAAYGRVAGGRALAVFGSSGFLEIGVRDGSAAKGLRLRAGSPVTVRPASPRNR